MSSTTNANELRPIEPACGNAAICGEPSWKIGEAETRSLPDTSAQVGAGPRPTQAVLLVSWFRGTSRAQGPSTRVDVPATRHQQQLCRKHCTARDFDTRARHLPWQGCTSSHDALNVNKTFMCSGKAVPQLGQAVAEVRLAEVQLRVGQFDLCNLAYLKGGGGNSMARHPILALVNNPARIAHCN